MRCGLRATVVEYIDSRNVKVLFEDGYSVWCKYGNFLDGNVKHYPYCVGRKLFNRYGDTLEVISQDRNVLIVKNDYDNITSQMTIKEFEGQSLKCKSIGKEFYNIDNERYRVIKVYFNRDESKKSRQCDVMFENNTVRQVDFCNAISNRIEARPRRDGVRRLPPQDFSREPFKSLEREVKSREVSEVRRLERKTNNYKRDKIISDYVKMRSLGFCDLCGRFAPFLDKKGNPYLESHHVVWVTRGGSDSIDNMVALCPECHKRVHILDSDEDIVKLNARLEHYESI